MAVPTDARELPARTALVAVRPPAGEPPAPTTADVALGAATLAVGAARSAVDTAARAGRRVARLVPVPGFVRASARQAWSDTAREGARTGAALRARLDALLDAVLPQVAREVLSRLDLTRLVGEFVDLDRVAAGLDVDAVADRVDIARILDRVDIDQVAARLDIARILDRVDIDQVADRVDLDRAADRVDLDRAAARIDIDAILDRVDIVGLARYVIDAIDLPEIIRSSTGSMTSDMVHGVRVQGADADEAVQRVVDRLLHRRGHRSEPAPAKEPR